MDGDDDLFVTAERQEFGYYLTVAYMSADPNDWPTFRRAIHGALVGSYLDRDLAHDVPVDETPDQQHTMRLLDEIRASHNPAISWAGFVLALIRDNGRTRGTGPLSLKSVREVHVTLHRALEDAVRWEYFETNPSDRATAPPATAARNERRKRIRTWSAAEVNAFAVFIEGHELHELWALAASTGLRRSELLGLRWIDLDLERRLLSVRRVLVKVGGA